MANLKASFQRKFSVDIPINIEDQFPTHVAVDDMIEIVCAASEKIGIDRYAALKHFQFTETEIKEHFQRHRNVR